MYFPASTTFVLKNGEQIESAPYFRNIDELHKFLGVIEGNFQCRLEENQRLQEQNKKLKDEHFADEKLKELNEKLREAREDLCRGFGITKEEMTKIKQWQEKHDAEQHNLHTFEQRLSADGTIGGRYHYEFYPTSLGTSGYCVCGKCKARAFKESNNKEEYDKLIEKYNASYNFSDWF